MPSSPRSWPPPPTCECCLELWGCLGGVGLESKPRSWPPLPTCERGASSHARAARGFVARGLVQLPV